MKSDTPKTCITYKHICVSVHTCMHTHAHTYLGFGYDLQYICKLTLKVHLRGFPFLL